jgi:NDP-sugar pyrophosphorylase family protein
MSLRTNTNKTVGIVLVGTHPWTNTAFDRLPPRPLLPVGHRPLLSYTLFWLRDGGIDSAAVCANRETQVLESRLHRHVPVGLAVSYHEDAMPRGTAGAVRDAADASDADMFVVADGTAVPNVDLSSVLAAHHARGAAVTVVLHAEPLRSGQPAFHVPSGIYVFDRRALALVPARGFCDIKENLIPQLHRAGERVCAYTAEHPSPRVLDSSSYRAVNEWMVEHLVSTRVVPEGYVLSAGCLVHRDASIARTAVLVGPVLVGPGASIGPAAVIVGPTSIGREAVVGAHVLLSRSAVWRRSVVQDGAVADRCILADDSVISAGTHVFREVLVARGVQGPAAAHGRAVTEARERPSLELLRKMSRVVLGHAAWSRYPAAQ